MFIINTITLIVCILFILPIIWLYNIAKNNRKEYNDIIIFDSLEHVINKLIQRADLYKLKNYNCIFYSFELTKYGLNNVINYQIKKISKILIVDLIVYLTTINYYKPKLVEIYYEHIFYHQLIHILINKIYKINNISIVRGELGRYYGNVKTWLSSSFINKHLIRLCLLLSDLVLYREPYLGEICENIGISGSKLIFDYNKIKVNDKVEKKLIRRNILFLNSFKEVRRPNLFLDSIEFVIEKYPDTKFFMVGARNNNEVNKVKLNYKKYVESGNLLIYKWTDDPSIYYNNCSIFILPADLVFCNYSLLEAMERSLVPIVSNVIDVDIIIQHKINGLIAEQSPQDISSKIILLLENYELYNSLSERARDTIVVKFNNRDSLNPIFNFFKI